MDPQQWFPPPPERDNLAVLGTAVVFVFMLVLGISSCFAG